MRPATLTLSVLVHGGILGIAAAVGVYAVPDDAPLARIEVQSLEESVPVPPAPKRRSMPVEEEESPPDVELVPAPELPVEPIEPEAEEPPPVVEPPRVRPKWTADPIVPRPVESPSEPSALAESGETPVEESAPEHPPEKAQVRVAAQPLASNRPPSYPLDERARGLEGEVVVGATVDCFGLVVAVRLLEKSRYPGFNRAALAAVRRWRFEPAKLDGRPVEGEVRIPIEFRIVDAR